MIVGGSAPQDLDGNGLYRDIDGDGTFDLVDVRLFFENLSEPVIQYNPAFFNFDEGTPANADLDDVRALYQAYLDSQSTLDASAIDVSEMNTADFERHFR